MCVDVLCIVVGGGRCVTKLSQCVHQWWQVCDKVVTVCTPGGGRCVTQLSQGVHHVWQVCDAGGRCVTKLSQCVHHCLTSETTM